LREALQKLKDTEFVYEQSLYPVTEYLFKHPLTQEVALASQLQEKRKKLHAAVAQVIEAAHAGDLDQQSALLAHHWEQAADLEQAVRWHRRTAEWASTRDPIEGLTHWRKVRELGQSLADDEAKDSRLRACSVIMASGTWRLGMSEEDVRECMDEARELARDLGRPDAMAVPLGGLAVDLGVRGHAQLAFEVAQEARAMIHDGMNPGDHFWVLCVYAYCILFVGRLHQAIEACDHIVELSGGDPHVGREVISFSPLIFANDFSALALATAGRFDECWQRMERAVRLAREHNVQESLAMALADVANCAYIARGTSRVPVGIFAGYASRAWKLPRCSETETSR
jgi:adenylate cyclase